MTIERQRAIAKMIAEIPVVRRAASGNVMADTDERAWVQGLAGVIVELEHRWQVTAEVAMTGGLLSAVLACRRTDGTKAVLKLNVPSAQTSRELAALQVTAPDAVVRVLELDEQRGAVLLERLGKAVSASRFSIASQLRISVRALEPIWDAPVDLNRFASALHWVGEQRLSLPKRWALAGEPCPKVLITRAVRAAEQILAADAELVFLHGDALPSNLLKAAGGRWKWIDLMGQCGPRACDLGKLLSFHGHEIPASQDASPTLQLRCEVLADEAGVDATSIWQWSLLHRVGSGLFLKLAGYPAQGDTSLRAAEAMALDTFGDGSPSIADGRFTG